MEMVSKQDVFHILMIVYPFNSNAWWKLNKQIINIGPDEEFVTINKVAELCSNVTGVNLPPIYKKTDLKR